MTAFKTKKASIDCLRCEHFYVTWDESFPRGCKAFGFKSRNIPSIDVSRSSGMECGKFKPKGKEGVHKG